MKDLRTHLMAAAVCLTALLSTAAHATVVTWEFGGQLEFTDGFGVAVGDDFSVAVSFDTEATLQTVRTGGFFSPGARYEYDGSSIVFDVSLGGGAFQQAYTAGSGFNLIWLRDNSGDASRFGEAPVVDGISIAIEGSGYSGSLIFRGSILDIFNGGALPDAPDPRLLDLELARFTLLDGAAFAQGDVTRVNVPVPASLPLVAIGLASLLLHRRRRRPALPAGAA